MIDNDAPAAFLEQLQRACKPVTVGGENTVSSLTPCTQSTAHCKIGFANLSEQIPFAVDVRRSIEQAVQHAGNMDLVVADNQLNSEVALQVADRLIAAGVDLAIEYQIDDRVNSVVANKFRRAGIPVIAVDDPILGATYFGVDNDQPDLLRDILQHLTTLWIAIWEEVTAHVELDVAHNWEDMSSSRGSMISPALFHEFMTQYHKQVTDFLKGHGVKVILVDTDGNCKHLIPLFLEAGVETLNRLIGRRGEV